MTYREWYRQLTEMLTEAGCDSPAFDALCLLTDVGGLPASGIPGAGREAVAPEREAALQAAAARRVAGYPLQYLLGEWDFLDLHLAVGEGVLIPRPDTELLCEVAARRLKTAPPAHPRVLDLCAGTGCVGLGVASLCPGADVTAVEWSDVALRYLNENMSRYPQYAVQAVRADVLCAAPDFEDGWDAILSNPPYIPAADIPLLSREVRCEPVMALDGGDDGLRFYRVLARDWLPKLAPGGFCAVEVGIGQAAAVGELFAAAGLRVLPPERDLGGIDRVVVAERL